MPPRTTPEMSGAGRRRRGAPALVAVVLCACGHVPRVIQTTAVGRCEGAPIESVARPSWIEVADIDHDGDADLLLLDVHPPAASGAWASIVPLRAVPGGYCQDAHVRAWFGLTAAPAYVRALAGPDLLSRLLRLRAADLDDDGTTDLIVWSPVTFEVVVLHGTGEPRRPFVATAPRPPVPPLRDTPRELRVPSHPGERVALDLHDVDGDGRRDLVLHVWQRGRAVGVYYAAAGARDFQDGRFFGDLPELPLDDRALVWASTRTSRERRDLALADAQGRVYVSSPEVRGAPERPAGRRRIATPFAADYAVYLDLTLADTYGLRALVIGAGRRVAVQADRRAPHRWRVLRLP